MLDLAKTVAYSAGQQPESVLKNGKAEDLQGPRVSKPIHELDWLSLLSMIIDNITGYIIYLCCFSHLAQLSSD